MARSTAAGGISAARCAPRTNGNGGWNSYREIAEYAAKTSKLILGHRTAEPLRVALHQHRRRRRPVHRRVGMPNVKVHLDTFHMIREERQHRRGDARYGPSSGLLPRLRKPARHSWTGLVPWNDVFRTFKEIGYDGCVTIESFDPNMERIAKLCCIWRKLADSPEQLATEGLQFLKRIKPKWTPATEVSPAVP